MALYFAYGSNINLRQMQKRCGNTWRVVGIGYVEGYKLVFDGYSKNWGGGVASLVEEQGNKVWGVVFELKEGFDCLDRYEGYPDVYKRKKVRVFVPESGEYLEAETYIKNELKGLNNPSESYLNTIIEGARENGLPEDWIKILESYRRMSDFEKKNGL